MAMNNNTRWQMAWLTIISMMPCTCAWGLEEIVVTAQKREQNINDVGVAVTAFSGEQMDSLGIESSTDLIAFTPGVSLAGDIGGQRAIFNIRGVVQNDYADHAEAPLPSISMTATWPAPRHRHSACSMSCA